MEIKYLTDKQINKIFRQINNPRDLAIFKLIYTYGLRRAEASNILLSDIDIEDRSIVVQGAKNGLKRLYNDMPPETYKALKNYLKIRNQKKHAIENLFVSRKNTPLTGYHINRLFKKYAIIAKIPEDLQHVHVLRHSIAVKFASEGIPIKATKNFLRHRDIQSTDIYYQFTNRRQNEYENKVFKSL